MGTLQTTIKLNDQFSKQLNKINKSIQNTANAMNRLNGVNATAVKGVNRALSQQISQHNTIMNQMNAWAKKLRTIGTLYYGIRATIQGIGKVVGLSDRMTMADARLGLMTDKNNSLKDLQTKAFGAAMRSRTGYLDFTKAVTKMGILAGDKFANQDSIIRFTELMNKQFQVGGADITERNAAMLQLTQAIASNRLGGDELRTIRETAPLLVKYIQKSLGVGEAEFKKLAKEGEITADVIIKAMAESSGELEKMFNKLPLTWETVWTRFKNVGVMAFQPIQEQLKGLFNNQRFLQFMVGLQNAMIVLGHVGGWVLKTLFNLVGWVADIFVKFRGIIWSVIFAFMIYKGVQLLIIGVTKLHAVWTAILSGLQAVLQMLIGNWAILIVAVLALAIFWIYKTSDGWIDAISRMIGGLFWLWEVVKNIGKFIVNLVVMIVDAIWETLKYLWEFIKVLGYNIGVAFANGWIHAQNAFWNFIKGCLNGIKFLEPAINAVAKAFGKKGFSISGTISNIEGKIQNTKSYKSLPSFGHVNTKFLDYGDLGAAYDKGYGKSEKFLTGVSDKIADLTKLDLDMSKAQLDALNGINNGVGDMGDKLGDVAGNTGDTAKNTKDTAKNTGSTNDYSYLRNWAYQSGLGNSIGYNIKIEQNNKNNIGSNMDLNRVVDAVRDAIIEGITIQAEGV